MACNGIILRRQMLQDGYSSIYIVLFVPSLAVGYEQRYCSVDKDMLNAGFAQSSKEIV